MNNKTIKKRDPGLPRHKCKTLLKKKKRWGCGSSVRTPSYKEHY
jgi:hypothetical protein